MRHISINTPLAAVRIGYTGRMPTFLRAATALSAVVTALCAVVLTVVVVSGHATVPVEQLRTFDQAVLADTVFDQVWEKYPDSGISGPRTCPGHVAVKEDVTFTCTFGESRNAKKVRVRVVDTYSGELEVGAPTP